MEMHVCPARESRPGGSSWRRRLVALAPLGLLVLALLAVPAVALAAGAPTQATLTGESPAVGAVAPAKSPPTSVKLTFSTNLDAAASDIFITDARGNGVSAGPLVVKNNTMTVNMHADGNGTYLVSWHALASAKGSTPTIGAYTFAIGAASNPSGEVGSTSRAVSSFETGAPPWVVVVVGIAGLIIGFAVSRLLSARPAARPAPAARPPARPSKTTDEAGTPPRS